MSAGRTVSSLLDRGAAGDVAITAPGREPLTFAGLRAHVARMVEALNGYGIGRNDRVALVLPNGAEAAAAFVSIAAAATVAPLNPAYRAPEFELHLAALRAQALVILSGARSPAVDVAGRLGVPVIELNVPSDAPAGGFTLCTPTPTSASCASVARGGADADDIALVLHTSGTTSQPKVVPLTQANLCASALQIGAALALTPTDCCLNIMPLFHIHGLMAAVLASLAAGASVACTPGFDAWKQAAWMQTLQPTWYTAVPAMHQAILARMARHTEIRRAGRLRLLRSSSAPLAPSLLAALEAVFDVPVIEGYGMTEAAHQMAANPLPPRIRKPGTVGLPAGSEIGEEVAAAVVLHAGAHAGERDIRAFVASRLADFKVPRRIVILDAIPRGATGKPQRIGLAATLGLTGSRTDPAAQ